MENRNIYGRKLRGELPKLKKLYHYSESLDENWGGPAFSIPSLARELYNFENVFVSKDSKRKRNKYILSNWIKLNTFRCHLNLFYSILTNKDKNNAVFIHTIWDPYILFVAFLFFAKKYKIIFFVRGSLKINRFKKFFAFYLFVFPVFLLSSKIVLSTNSQVKSEVPFFLKNKIIVLPNIIKDFVVINRQKTRSAGYLGRLHPHKRVEYIIEILSHLPDYELLIAGPGEETPYAKKIRTLAAKNFVKVTFLGLITGEDKYLFLHNNSFHLLTSKSENFGNVVFESLKSGVPCFVSKNLYISEYLHPCLIIDYQNSEASAKKIKNYFNFNMGREPIEYSLKQIEIKINEGMEQITSQMSK